MSLGAASITYRDLNQFTSFDLDVVRPSLTNENILQWNRLAFTNDTIAAFYQSHLLDFSLESDLVLFHRIRDEAITYLQEEFNFPLPKPIQKSSLSQLLITASDTRNKHRQFGACTLLKAIHIINHFDASEARQALKITDQELFRKAENRVYQVIGQMMADRHPIVEFMGGRKQRTSMVTKLMSKKDPLSAQLFDKMRFRVVTATRDDILPIINYLSQTLLPFNYILSGESHNSLLNLDNYIDAHDKLRHLYNRDLLPPPTPAATRNTLVENVHTSPKYQVIHWVTDMPVRIANYKTAYITDGLNPVPRPIIYVRAEIQLLDWASHRKNETGHAAHDKYKSRQRSSVLERLRVRQTKGDTL